MDVLTLIANPTIRDVGAVAILVLVVLMILSGRLIPKATHDREIAAAEKRIAEAVHRGDEWKATAKATEEVNAVVRAQNTELIEANKVVKSFLQASGPSAADTLPAGGV